MKNTLAFDATVTTLGQTETIGIVRAGESAIFTHDGSDVRIGGVAPDIPTLAGVTVRKAAEQTAADYTTPIAVVWDEEDFDTDGFHDNVTENTRLTIPAKFAGFYADVMAYISASLTTNDEWAFVKISHFNSADSLQRAWNANHDLTRPFVNALAKTSHPVLLAEGDYFTATFAVQTDTSISIGVDSSFSLQIVGR